MALPVLEKAIRVLVSPGASEGPRCMAAPPEPDESAAKVQFSSVGDAPSHLKPPPFWEASFFQKVQKDMDAVQLPSRYTPPPRWAEFLLNRQPVRVGVAP